MSGQTPQKSGGVDASEDQDVLDTVNADQNHRKRWPPIEKKPEHSELASEAFMAMTNAPETYSGVELDKGFAAESSGPMAVPSFVHRAA